MRSFGGVFYTALSDGRLVGINGASGAIDSNIKTSEGAIADIAVESADEAYISFVDNHFPRPFPRTPFFDCISVR